MMKFRFMAVLLLLVSIAQAQTKRIAHYSHSGTALHFKSALANTDFNDSHSNFGRAPERIVKNAQLDSLIVLDADRIVMVTSTVCTDRNQSNRTPIIWQAGRDTVEKHPDFSPLYNVADIKQTLTQKYHFVQKKPTVFVGYEKPVPASRYQAPTYIENNQTADTTKPKQEMAPFKPNSDHKTPHLPISVWATLAVIGSILFGLVDFARKNKWSKASA